MPRFAHICTRFVVLAVVLFAVLSLLAGCERGSTAGMMRLDSTSLATHRSSNPLVQFMDSSYLKAVLKAAWAEVYESRQQTLLGGGVRVEFRSRATGAVVSVLTADSAVIDDKTKNMTAIGNVVVVSDAPPRTVRTSLMMWDNARQKLHSTAFVSIVSPEEILQGYGFESDQNLEHYVIYNVSGQTMLMPLGDSTGAYIDPSGGAFDTEQTAEADSAAAENK
jgi:LPS export ABC transporter protein LptC